MTMEKVVPSLIIIVLLFVLSPHAPAQTTDEESGLVVEKGFETVKEICTSCHSAKLITQNRMDRQGWLETIRWMQETQGLWEFDPDTEKEILDYLSSNYAPVKTYRRPPLTVEWE